MSLRQVIVIGGGVVAALLVYWLLPGGEVDAQGVVVKGLTHAGRATAAVGALMAVWWMTEAIPVEATGLVPLTLFPILKIAPVSQAAGPYADKVIFLFLGGMILGAALERWGLHTRAAMFVVGRVGASPRRLVLGVLLATAVISMWVSNTAAAVLMLPIGASLSALLGEPGKRHAAPIVLAVAYGASIGGLGTLIGTPPTAQFAAFAEKSLARPVTFAEWMGFGVPVMAVLLVLAYVVLTRVAFRVPGGSGAGVREALRARSPGAWSRGEIVSLIVFVAAGALWSTTAFTRLDDATIAIGAALALFLIPVEGGRAALTWREAEKLPWGVLLLFGGGLSLAAALSAHGVDRFVAGHAQALSGLPVYALLLVVALATILLSELASNTALVAVMLPIAGAVAPGVGVPEAVLLVTVTLSGSLGFMLPPATPPNAIVFASGRVSMRTMIHAGVWMDAACALLVPAIVLAAWKLGILPGV